MNLSIAYSITATAFESINDKNGHPYFDHCLAVMNGVSHHNDTELSIIALMHDLIEDTSWKLKNPLDNLYQLYLDSSNFYQISERIYNGLQSMTHIKSDSYSDYIYKLSLNPDAIIAKLSDLTHNSQLSRNLGTEPRDIERITKYTTAYNFLRNLI